jgi:hypothetical protein
VRSSGTAKIVIGRWRTVITDVHPPDGWTYNLVPNPKFPTYGNEVHLIPPDVITSAFKATFSLQTADQEVEAFQWRTEEAETRLLKEQGHIKRKNSY